MIPKYPSEISPFAFSPNKNHRDVVSSCFDLQLSMAWVFRSFSLANAFFACAGELR